MVKGWKKAAKNRQKTKEKHSKQSVTIGTLKAAVFNLQKFRKGDK